MKTYRVYTIKLARYLTEKGFKIEGTTQDVKNPKLINWFFADSEQLRECV